MSFSSEFDSLALAELSAFSQNATAADVEAALARSGKRVSLADFGLHLHDDPICLRVSLWSRRFRRDVS